MQTTHFFVFDHGRKLTKQHVLDVLHVNNVPFNAKSRKGDLVELLRQHKAAACIAQRWRRARRELNCTCPISGDAIKHCAKTVVVNDVAYNAVTLYQYISSTGDLSCPLRRCRFTARQLTAIECRAGYPGSLSTPRSQHALRLLFSSQQINATLHDYISAQIIAECCKMLERPTGPNEHIEFLMTMQEFSTMLQQSQAPESLRQYIEQRCKAKFQEAHIYANVAIVEQGLLLITRRAMLDL